MHLGSRMKHVIDVEYVLSINVPVEHDEIIDKAILLYRVSSAKLLMM
jgi:hypothetical protein